MYQRALIVYLKWISGVSLPFRPSLPALTLTQLEWQRCLLQPGAEGRNHSVRDEMKRAALVRLAWGTMPESLWAAVDLVASAVLRSHHKQHIRRPGKPVAKAWNQTPANPHPPPRDQRVPSYWPWSTITTRHLPFHSRNKGWLILKETNGWIITISIKLKESLQQKNRGELQLIEISLHWPMKKKHTDPPYVIRSFNSIEIFNLR